MGGCAKKESRLIARRIEENFHYLTAVRHLQIASRDDLLRLKKIAHAKRKSATDAQDIAFLKRKSKQLF